MRLILASTNFVFFEISYKCSSIPAVVASMNHLAHVLGEIQMIARFKRSFKNRQGKQEHFKICAHVAQSTLLHQLQPKFQFVLPVVVIS